MKNSIYQPSGLAVLVTIMAFLGCTKEVDITETDGLDGTAEIGKHTTNKQLLQNPYEIHAFRRAYQKVLDSLEYGNFEAGKTYQKTKTKDTSQIVPNYRYMKFSPETDQQENKLREHRKIVFIDYPFEYEDGEQYHKANPLDDGERLSFYTSIPVEAKYPKNIPHTILQEMYIPERDEDLNNMADKSDKGTERGKVNNTIDFMNHVIEQAYKDTNNEDLLVEPLLDNKKETCETCLLGINLGSRWRPSGNVQIFDDNLGTSSYTVMECQTSYTYDYTPCYYGDYGNCPKKVAVQTCTNVTKTRKGSYVPIDGANILIRDTWTLDRAIADSQGNFKHREVAAKVRYIIKWDRFEFSIRDHSGLFQAEDSGPKLYKQPWNLKISGGRMKYRGQIFQAAMHFYYHNIGGLTRPPTNNFWKTQIKIAAVETNEGPSSTKMQAGHGTFGIVPHIKIKRYGLSSEKVYGTTIHELAHAAHWRVDPISWDDLVEQGYLYNFGSSNPGPAGASARRLMESWATGVEIYLTNMRYRRLGPNSYMYMAFQLNGVKWGNLQNVSISEKFYTTGIYDLYDSFNQRIGFGAIYYQLPYDNVSGFSMKTLENVLIGSTRWEEYRNKIIAISGNSKDVKTLFDSW